jgi:predicted negative regulator of RcsB-dependent stress response
MNRNVLYLIIGALVVASVVFGYQYYQAARPASDQRRQVVFPSKK